MNRSLVRIIYGRSLIKIAHFDEMSKCYRGPSIYAPYTILVKQFQRKTFLEINPSETRIACGGYVC
jgi:hypothetical protein